MNQKEKKDIVNRCLDEIEAAYRSMVKSKVDQETIFMCKSWVRQQRKVLKEIGYIGSIPRQPRIMSKCYKDQGSLFDEDA